MILGGHSREKKGSPEILKKKKKAKHMSVNN
jgi:hypothetical protein